MAPPSVFSTTWIESVIGMAVQRGTTVGFSGITSDSRTVPADTLFLPLTGERFDGHDFVVTAFEKGAAGAVISEHFWQRLQNTPALRAQTEGRWLFVVPGVEAALTQLGQHWRTRFRPHPLVAVGGSAGKTTTKELLGAILRGRFGEDSVLKTEGSQNGFVGIPSTLLKLRPKDQPQIAVIEIGIDEPGTMRGHAQTVMADVALLTAIAPEHLEKLKDLETVAREELILLEETLRLQDHARVVLNLDEPFIVQWFNRMPKDFQERALGVSLPASPGVNLLGANLPPPSFVGRETESGELEITENESIHTRLPLPLPGEHHARNLLLAATAARALGLSWEEIKKGLATFKGAFGRTEIKSLDDGTWAICDYYNANPASVRAGISVLEALAQKKTKDLGKRPELWACLGDMLELGAEEEALHRALAADLLQARVDHILLFGPRMKSLATELATHPRSGNTSPQVSHYETREALGAALATHAAPHAVVLIKGSRGMKMEDAWKVACAQRSDWAKGI